MMKISLSRKLLYSLLLPITLLGTGCDFFGKKVEDARPSVPGEMADGTSIVGQWSVSSSSIARTNTTPDSAMTTTFAFDPNGSARIEVREQKGAGSSCTGYGQYRLVGQDNFMVYIQSADCAFPGQIELTSVRVNERFLTYTDRATGHVSQLYANREQQLAPVGVWDFAGAGGIDYLFFDQHGYFLLQTTVSGTAYLIEGYYVIAGGGIALNYFEDSDPGRVVGTEVFSQFVTNSTELMLEQMSTSGTDSYLGVKR